MRTVGRRRTVAGWVDGLLEGIEPSQLEVAPGVGKGILRSATNVLATRTGRLAVRGGSAAVQSLTTPGGAPISQVLSVVPYSQYGAVAVGYDGSAPKHYLWRLTPTLAFATGVEASSRHDLGWNGATPTHPVITELFEELYLADATEDYTVRDVFKSVDSAGTVTTPVYDLDGDDATPAEAMKPYCVAAFNSVLFVAGYDSEAVGGHRAPHLVRHSMLGVKPSLANGFDKDAYATIGSQGLPVRAMVPGQNVLLVAKDQDLYRITGAGRGLPGWQYAIAQLDQSRGFGCANPLALCHVKGQWFGVGQAGPFVTDGASVEGLAGLRVYSWRTVQRLDFAWVAHSPDRDVVLFAVNQTGFSGRSSVYPFRLWVWDIERESWIADLDFSVNLAYAQAIGPASALSLPASGAPTAGPFAVVIDHASATLSSVTGSFTIGDVTASTEVRVRLHGGTSGYTLFTTLAPGVSTFTITGLTNYSLYDIQLAHIKTGIYSPVAPTAFGYTRIPATDLTGFGPPGPTPAAIVRWYHHAGGSQLVIQRKVAGADDSTYVTLWGPYETAVGPGELDDDSATCGVTYTYRADANDATRWPLVIAETFSSVNVHACAGEADPGPPGGLPPGISVRTIGTGDIDETADTVLVQFDILNAPPGATYELQWSYVGGGAGPTIPLSAPVGMTGSYLHLRTGAYGHGFNILLGVGTMPPMLQYVAVMKDSFGSVLATAPAQQAHFNVGIDVPTVTLATIGVGDIDEDADTITLHWTPTSAPTGAVYEIQWSYVGAGTGPTIPTSVVGSAISYVHQRTGTYGHGFNILLPAGPMPAYLQYTVVMKSASGGVLATSAVQQAHFEVGL